MIYFSLFFSSRTMNHESGGIPHAVPRFGFFLHTSHSVPIAEVVKIGRGITFPLGILSKYTRNIGNHDTNLKKIDGDP